MKENIKIGLLALVAVTLVVNTYLQFPTSTKENSLNNTSGINQSPNQGQTYGDNMAGINPPPATSLTPDGMNQAPAVPSGPATSISFKETTHNFGKIKQESQGNKHVFKFTNTGKEPLIIENAVGSCGCTVPSYPKEPIAPGKTGEIEVEYSPGKQQGKQDKTVTVTANTEPKQTLLTISAEVEVVSEK